MRVWTICWQKFHQAALVAALMKMEILFVDKFSPLKDLNRVYI